MFDLVARFSCFLRVFKRRLDIWSRLTFYHSYGVFPCLGTVYVLNVWIFLK